MNASLSDGNEPVIDIFILSANSLLSTQLEKQLRDEGYTVTLFSDGTHLLETLRNGKPNLLMCDSTVPDADAFEVCRQIKADDFLWNIPVLIITGAADLGDLLRVLDCNADNFIAHPFDTPYLLSLIEGMLTVPVERQTPEQIKTQFKIKHADQIFVVTADRRKLLEFLLSSFEIAVNKSTDLSRAVENIQNLGFACRKLEDTVKENTRVINIINENLKTREQELATLTGQLADKEQTVREQNASLDQISQDFSLEKSAHAETRSEFERVTREKDSALAAQRFTSNQLQQQVSDLSSELATLKSALERTNEELLRESSRLQDTENELRTNATQKDQAEKALGVLTTEYEELKVNLVSETNRVQEAEHELKAVLHAKTQSEQDLAQIIEELKTTAKEQAAAIIRLKEESESENARFQEELESERARFTKESESENAQFQEELESERERFTKELESERARLLLAEENLNTVTAEKEQSEASLQATIDERQKNLAGLQARLEEKEQAVKTLTQEIATVSSAQKSAEQELASVSRILTETNAALNGKKRDNLELEARLNTARSQVEEKEQAINNLTKEIATARSAQKSAEQELASVSRSLSETNTALEAETRSTAARKEEFARVMAEKEKAEVLAESLAVSLKELRDQLEQEKSRSRENEAGMNAIIMQRDRELEELRGLHEDARTAVSSQMTTLEQVQKDLDAADSARTELEEKLEQEKGRSRENEERMNVIILQRDRELAELRRVHEDTTNALSSHTAILQQMRQDLDTAVSARTEVEEKLERVTINLENETIRRQEAEDQLRDALSQQQQVEQDLERIASETKALRTDLTAERRMHEAVSLQNRSLEEQVAALGREKLEAEQAAASLTTEIDQARVALADEWEDHMTDQERFEEVAGKKQQPEPAPASGVRKEAEIIKRRALIVKAPTMPTVIRPLPRSIVTIDPVKASEPETSHIKSVEDLFEDDNNAKEKTSSGEPVVSIIQEPATEPVQDVLPDSIPGRSDEQDSFFEEGPSAPDTWETFDKDDMDDGSTEQGDTTRISGQNIAFDREQWLDLLKWSHYCGELSQDQRMQIVRMGRLIQKGRKLTNKQEEQVLEMIALVQRLGYRIP